MARVWRVLVVALAAVLLLGCASPYAKLVREDSLPDLRAAKHATLSRPVRTILAPTRGPDGAELKVAVHLLEGGQADRLLVFVHGVFADHETWRFVAGNLARDHAVWLVDMPGCGGSEPARDVGHATYTIPDVAERTLQALRHCLVTASSPRIALVGHSYGAAVIVRMFSDPGLRERYSDVVQQVDRLVLVSPLDVALNAPAPVYKMIAEASAFRVRAAVALGELRRRVAKATFASVEDPSRALKEEADKKIEVLRDSSRRIALQQMIAKAVPWKAGLRPDWNAIEAIEDSYARVDRECLIIVGMRDEALPASMAYKMAIQLPRSSFVPLKGIMHSPHIEAHERCATLIREFVTTGRVSANVLTPRGEH
jgi:pimeloyl-ACP methyl ester carboxylesterase